LALGPFDRYGQNNTSPTIGVHMSIGLGIVLGVVGAIFITGAIEIPASWPIDSEPLGWILLIAGIIAIVLSLVINRQRTQRTTSEPPRTDPPRNTY